MASYVERTPFVEVFRCVRFDMTNQLLEVFGDFGYVNDLLNRFEHILSSNEEEKIIKQINKMRKKQREACTDLLKVLLAAYEPKPPKQPTYLKLAEHKAEIVEKLTGKSFQEAKNIILSNGQKITDYIPEENLKQILDRKKRQTPFS